MVVTSYVTRENTAFARERFKWDPIEFETGGESAFICVLDLTERVVQLEIARDAFDYQTVRRSSADACKRVVRYIYT